MKKYLFFASSFLLYILCQPYWVVAQSIASVNPLQGSANVSIPIYTISNGQVSIPISLNYSSGIKPLDVEGSGGMGWQVVAGGQVSRLVRGLPDDVTKDGAGNSRLGWMSSLNTAANAIAGFNIQNDGGVTCSKETTDISSISTNFPFNFDTEPDAFNVSAPGLSCQILFNRATGKFVPVNYNDIIITYTSDAASGLITSFTITDNQGIKYVFSANETVKQTTKDAVPTYFATMYKQYQYGITFSDSWLLTSITDPLGNGLILTYITGNFTRDTTDPISLYLPGSSTPTLQYNIQQHVTVPQIDLIKTNNANAGSQGISFLQNSGENVITRIDGMGRTFNLNYSHVYYGSSNARSFLRSFTDATCGTPINYRFTYGGETPSSAGDYTTILPDSNSTKVDYWGYATSNSNSSLQPKVWINPSNTSYARYAIYQPATGGGSYSYSTTNGNTRTAELTNFNGGNLTSITYAEGGTTTITYEPNTYLDVPSNQVVTGGGIRVKQITDYDGIDPAKNIVRNYSYNNPSGVSSGKPISLPSFAFTIPYSGSATGAALWNSNTVVSNFDLSGEDHTILYDYFKISQTGAGSTQYQFYNPATNWDSSAAAGCTGCATEWLPTVTNIARANCSASYGPINNGIANYPFIPNANYDFERGLLLSITNYNDANKEVSETKYTYLRSFTPAAITAFKYDDNVNGALSVRAYNKYKIYYNTSELTATETKKVFDAATLTQAQTSTANYFYNSAQHKLLTQQTATNSDQTVLTTNIRYVKDYTTASSGSNPNVNALYNLQQLNINSPVETWQQTTKAGVTKTVAANLTLYKGFVTGAATLYLPSQQLKLLQADGITNFAPFAISAQVSTADSRYFPVSNYTAYDNSGFLQTVDDGNRHVKTTIYDHFTNKATANFSNAGVNEIGFSDFDTDLITPQASNFTISGTGSFVANGSHSGNAYGLGSTQTVTKAITKSSLTANYTFSVWINAATAGNLNITLSGGVTSNFTKAFTAGGWAYYELKLPVGTLSSNFSISFTSSQPISVDDILFYPDVASAATMSYDPQTHYLIAETNTNGVSSYYKKDMLGRLLFQYDQDKNIVQKKSYISSALLAQGLTPPTFDGNSPTTVQVLTSNTFTATTSSCIAGVTYTWNFGDTTAIVTALNGNIQAHTYSHIGNHTITITATHPVFGTATATQVVMVKPPPLVPDVCRSGVTNWNNCTSKATRTVACGTNPNDTHTTYFTVNSVAGSGYGALTYAWQMSYDAGVSWLGAGGGTQLAIDCGGRDSRSYSVRCIITSTSGQSVTSATLGFSAPPCNP